MREFVEAGTRQPMGLRRGLTILLTVLVAHGAWASATAVLGMRAAMCGLVSASGDLRSLDLPAARAHLESAFRRARHGRVDLDHPLLSALALLPGPRREVQATRALADALQGASISGLAGVQAAEAALGRGDAAAALYRGGHVDLQAMDRIRPQLQAAQRYLHTSASVLDLTQPPRLAPVRRALARARSRLAAAGARIRAAGKLLDALPALAGHGRPARYFLAFQSPSEARGGGGLIGVYGILVVEDGKLELEEVEPIRKLLPQLDVPVEGPRWFARLYGGLLALRDWRQANLSPRFSASSEVLLRMYEASRGSALDGVIAMDPISLANITVATGPLEGPGWSVRVGPQNTRRALLRDIYLRFQNREGRQNAFLKGLVGDLWSKLRADDMDSASLGRAVAKSIRRQHLKVYVRDKAAADALIAAGLTGDYSARGPNVQLVFHNNFGANKIDFFLRRNIDTKVALTAEGDALVSTTVALRNDAPADLGGVLVRPGIERRLPAGLNRMVLSFLLPKGAQVKGWLTQGVVEDHLEGREGRYPVAWQALDLPAGRTLEIELLYEVPGAFDPRTGRGFELTLWPQVTARPDSFSITVVPPEGSAVTGAGRQPDEGVARRGRLARPVWIRARVGDRDRRPGRWPGFLFSVGRC